MSAVITHHAALYDTSLSLGLKCFGIPWQRLPGQVSIWGGSRFFSGNHNIQEISSLLLPLGHTLEQGQLQWGRQWSCQGGFKFPSYRIFFPLISKVMTRYLHTCTLNISSKVMIAFAQGVPVDAVCASVADVCRRKSTSAACKSSGYVSPDATIVACALLLLAYLPIIYICESWLMKVHLVIWVWM